MTKTLILVGCKNLNGKGLAPLAGSTVLRGLDIAFCLDEFRNTMLHIPDVESITSLLETMGPLGGNAQSGFLLWIRSPFWGGSNFLNLDSLKRQKWEEMERTLARFRSSLATRVRDSDKQCNCCEQHLYNKIVSASGNASDCKFCKRVKECRHAWDNHLRSFPDETEEDIFPLISNHHTSNSFLNFAAKLVCYQCNKMACGQKICPETLRCCSCTMQLCSACNEMIICCKSFFSVFLRRLHIGTLVWIALTDGNNFFLLSFPFAATFLVTCKQPYCGNCEGTKQCDRCKKVGICNNCIVNDRVSRQHRISVNKCSGTLYCFCLFLLLSYFLRSRLSRFRVLTQSSLDFIDLDCGKKSCCDNWGRGCTEMMEGRSARFCYDCRDLCNVCEEPFEKDSGYECTSCETRIPSAKICPDCFDKKRCTQCDICNITFCDPCWEELSDGTPVPFHRDCCKKSICRRCAPSTECETCSNEYCTEEEDCKRWHSRVCKDPVKRVRIEK